MGLGLKNQFILAKTIKFSVLVQQKLSVESSINDEKTKKRQNDEKVRLMYVMYKVLIYVFLTYYLVSKDVIDDIL